MMRRGFVVLSATCFACATAQPEAKISTAASSPVVPLTSLDSLAGDVAGKKVVMLGEPDHYVHEKWAYQLTFVRWLFERGFRTVGFEMGRARGQRFQRYIATGDEQWLGSPRKTASPKGMLSVDTEAGWIDNDAKERKAFMRALRQLSESRKPGTPPLRVFGFDVDFFLEDTLDELGVALGERPESLAVARERAAEKPELAPALREAEETSRFVEVAMNEPTMPQLMAAYAEREKTMFWQMDEAIARTPANEGIVLIGHNMHLSKDASSIRFGPVAGGQPMWKSVGTHLAETLGPKAYGVWMLYAGGTHGHHQCRETACAITPPPGTVEKRLEPLGDQYLLPLRPTDARVQFMFEDQPFIQNGALGSGRIGRQADLVMFQRQVQAPNPDLLR